MLKFQPSVIAVVLAIASLGFSASAQADTVRARCDVYPKGSDRVKSSGSCTFSQRQGFVRIQLQNGKRYDLSPVGNQPGNYRDQNGRAAYRQAGLGDQGQIYRLAAESIFVYWNAGGQTSQPAPSRPATSSTKFANLTASPGSRINVRSQPTVNSSSPHYGITGDRVEVLRCVPNRDTPGSDLNWCNVRFVQSQATGWVRSDFIVFSDGGE